LPIESRPITHLSIDVTMQPFDCRIDWTRNDDTPLTLTLETYEQSFGMQSFCMTVITSFLTVNKFLPSGSGLGHNPEIAAWSDRPTTEPLLPHPRHHNSYHQSDQWRCSVAFWLIQPRSYGIPIHQLILDILSRTSWDFFFQLVFLDFHDVP
jgi:hypothetical protein